MNFSSSVRYSVATLIRNRSRSILTSIGIIIGISSVIMIIGLTSSAKIAIKTKILSFGENGVSVVGKDENFYFHESDIAEIKKNPAVKNSTILLGLKKMRVRYRNQRMFPMLYGSDNDYLYIQNRRLLFGNFFSDNDLLSGRKVVIIGDAVRRKFFGFTDPVGNILSINNQSFYVIGSLAPKGKALTGENFDEVCIIPFRAIFRGFNHGKIRPQIYVQAINAQSVPSMIQFIESFYRSKNVITEGKNSVIDISENSQSMEVAENISKTLTYLLIAVAIISLIVGGIGIMNIMLVSVSERTREIGIRMAIGAKKRDVLNQFLIEAMTLCGLGGIAGIIIGILGYFGIVVALHWSFQFSILSIAVAFIFACAVGLFFGYYPAKKASQMNPIEALRFE